MLHEALVEWMLRVAGCAGSWGQSHLGIRSQEGSQWQHQWKPWTRPKMLASMTCSYMHSTNIYWAPSTFQAVLSASEQKRQRKALSSRAYILRTLLWYILIHMVYVPISPLVCKLLHARSRPWSSLLSAGCSKCFLNWTQSRVSTAAEHSTTLAWVTKHCSPRFEFQPYY